VATPQVLAVEAVKARQPPTNYPDTQLVLPVPTAATVLVVMLQRAAAQPWRLVEQQDSPVSVVQAPVAQVAL
jgi:hypothetical protein